jgi:hypothetical protein
MIDEDLRKEIVRLIEANIPLLNNNNVFYIKASSEITGLYCVFTITINNDSHDSASKFNRYNILFSIFNDDKSDIETVSKALKTLFDFTNASMTIDNHDVITFRKINSIPLHQVEDKFNKVDQYYTEWSSNR